MIPVSSVLLCPGPESRSVKEANEDANYRAGYFLVPFAIQQRTGRGTRGCLGKAEDRAAKRRSTSAAGCYRDGMLRWLEWLTPVRSLPPSRQPSGLRPQLTNYRGVKGKFCFNQFPFVPLFQPTLLDLLGERRLIREISTNEKADRETCHVVALSRSLCASH